MANEYGWGLYRRCTSCTTLHPISTVSRFVWLFWVTLGRNTTMIRWVSGSLLRCCASWCSYEWLILTYASLVFSFDSGHDRSPPSSGSMNVIIFNITTTTIVTAALRLIPNRRPNRRHRNGQKSHSQLFGPTFVSGLLARPFPRSLSQVLKSHFSPLSLSLSLLYFLG